MGERIKWSILSEDLQESFEYCDFAPEDDFKVEEEGDWVAEGKYQYCTNIFLRKSDGKYFSHFRSRSGSPFSDYYYDDPEDLQEVVKKEVITTTWVSAE